MALKNLFKWLTGDDSSEPDDGIESIDAASEPAPREQQRDDILKVVRPRSTSLQAPDTASEAFFADARRDVERMREEVWKEKGRGFGLPMATKLFATFDPELAQTMPALGSVSPAQLLASFGAKVDETSTGFCVTLKVAGFDEKDIKIEAADTKLTVTAEKRSQNRDDSRHLNERFVNRFEQVISLAAPIDADNIQSKLDGGVLHITVLKKH